MTPCGPGTCFVCRLAGLVDCHERGARLPLVELERADVAWKTSKATLLYGNGLTAEDRERIDRFLRDRG